jgi:hypothetical protein
MRKSLRFSLLLFFCVSRLIGAGFSQSFNDPLAQGTIQQNNGVDSRGAR